MKQGKEGTPFHLSVIDACLSEPNHYKTVLMAFMYACTVVIVTPSNAIFTVSSSFNTGKVKLDDKETHREHRDREMAEESD